MGSLFKGPKAPPQKPTPLLPDEDALKKQARKRAATRRGGRASTILTQNESKLGPA